MVVKRHGRRQQRTTGGEFVVHRSRWYLPSVAQYQANFCENAKFISNQFSCYCTSWYKTEHTL
jgi:hypothetical protein